MSERDPFHDSKRRGHPCDHAISSRADRLAAERARFDEWCGRHGYGHSPGLTDADKAWIDMRLAVRWEAWLAALGLDP